MFLGVLLVRLIRRVLAAAVLVRSSARLKALLPAANCWSPCRYNGCFNLTVGLVFLQLPLIVVVVAVVAK